MNDPGPAPAAPQPIVAEVVRSGFVECRHYGSVVALAPDGSVAWAVGDVRRPVLPRSGLKPLQALGMLRLGLDVPPDLLAVACSSHSGEEPQLEGVRRLLATVGLDESALQTPAELPLDADERDAVLRAGGGPLPLLMNCSGKHAAMLVSCVTNGWGIVDYLDPFHPVQRAIAGTVAELTGGSPQVTVDGCGAPALSTSLVGLADSFRLLALGQAASGGEDAGARRVAQAIRAHPDLVSGSRRDEARLLAAVPGAIAKSGAEACYAVALADGRAWAVKIDDGGERARAVVMAAALLRDGIGDEAGVDAEALADLATAEVSGGGARVGEVRAVLPT